MYFSKVFASKPESKESRTHLMSIDEIDSPLGQSRRYEENQPGPSSHKLRRTSSWRSRFTGWRGGLLMALTMSSFAFSLNLILAIVAMVAWSPAGGIATAFVGDCKTTGRLTTGMHLLINLLSSAILGASNYTMQRLAAPTRAEVDAAHRNRKWLDVGIPSVRNIFSISRKRSLLWLLLGLSSIPLHFLYNSIVFQTIAGNQIVMLTVSPEFFQEKDNWSFDRWGVSTDPNVPDTGYSPYTYLIPTISRLQSSLLDGNYLDRKIFHNLTKEECMDHYSRNFITDVGAGFAVITPDSRESMGVNATETLALVTEGVGNIEIVDDISYCLAEVVPQRCRVEFSLPILAVVLGCGAIKMIIMTIVLCLFNQQALVTIGDAIESFLLLPDPTTKGRCLMSKHNVDTMWEQDETQCPRRWEDVSQHRWLKSCSTRRLLFAMLLFLSAIAGAIIAYYRLRRWIASDVGAFGVANLDWLVLLSLPFPDSIIPPVLVANSPQVIASFLCMTYNGIFSCMLAGREWSQYATKRAPLRVTKPDIGQRSTYFIQVPWLWGISLFLSGGLLHWFVSQTWYLVRIALYQNGVQKQVVEDMVPRMGVYVLSQLHFTNGVTTTLGYSNVALVTTICWIATLICISTAIACIFKYPRGLPLGGTNSAVISASCHVKYEEREYKHQAGQIVGEPIMWGVTIRGGDDKVGHCSFSAGEVEQPENHHLYAG